MEDPELTAYEKQLVAVQSLYKEMPHDLQQASMMATKFLNGGEEVKESDEDAAGIRLYSFNKDAGLIYAAFRQTHGIDLSKEDLHWFEFMTLFMDLGADTTFCSLVSLRKRVKTGKANKSEKAAARELGEFFDVPDIDNRSLEEREKERAFMEKLGIGVQNGR